MERFSRRTGTVVALATGVLVLGLWYASVAKEPSTAPGDAPPEAAPAPSEAARREAEAFAHHALEALRAAGLRGELQYDAEQFLLRIPELEGQHGQTIFLSNFYDEYRSRPPELRAEALQRLVRFSASPPSGPTTYAAARPALLPVIRPRIYFELLSLGELGGSKDGGVKGQEISVLWAPLGEVLAQALVVDTPDAMKFVTPEDLVQWGVSAQQATADALENLRRQSREDLVVLAPGTCRATWNDSYGSSRMLLDEVLRRCPVRGEPVVLVPNRDWLLVTGSADEEGLLKVAELAQVGYGGGRPVDGRALRRTARGWEPFTPPKASQPWVALRRLWVESQRREYAAQAEQLNTLYSQQGVDLFVGEFIPYEDEHENVFSQAVWVRDIDTLLPQVDMVIFMDSKLGSKAPPVAVVRWELVQRDAGKLLAREPGLYPVRYRLKGFPSDEQLARWKKDPHSMDPP